DRREHFVDQRQFLAHVLEVNDLVSPLQLLDQRLELAKLNEAIGGDDAFYLGGLESARESSGATGEVEHRRHAPIRRDGEERDHRTGACRQKDADGLSGARPFLQGVSECERGANNVFVGEHAFIAVDDRGACGAVARTGLNERLKDGFLPATWVSGHYGLFAGSRSHTRNAHASTPIPSTIDIDRPRSIPERPLDILRIVWGVARTARGRHSYLRRSTQWDRRSAINSRTSSVLTEESIPATRSRQGRVSAQTRSAWGATAAASGTRVAAEIGRMKSSRTRRGPSRVTASATKPATPTSTVAVLKGTPSNHDFDAPRERLAVPPRERGLDIGFADLRGMGFSFASEATHDGNKSSKFDDFIP